MHNSELPDIGKIMQIAQEVASQIEPPPELKSGKKLSDKDMTSAIAKITKSVSSVINPDMLSDLSSKKQPKNTLPSPVKDEESKISFDVRPEEKKSKKKRIVEVETSDSDDDNPIAPRTKDMTFTLSVTLEDLYNGTKKKLALRRQKIDKDGSYQEEKKKLSVKIEPGMIDEQAIIFNHMADEKEGYETGDVVVTLDVEEHPIFIRDGNNLLIEKEISLSEAYKPIVYINHLNGQTFKVTGEPFDIFGDEDEMLKKIQGEGMPIIGEPGKYGDLFIRFKCVNKTNITPEVIEVLQKVFPPLNAPPDVENSSIIEKEFEMVTETDLEFLEGSDSEYSSSDESYSEEESSEV
tara:strand:- start:2869 stop:3918 length:1050 start_codon:yes stop_codon:yes gene_type:complete